MLNDLTQDQIYKSTWNTKIELDAVVKKLTNEDWELGQYNHSDFAFLSKNFKTVEVNLTHVPTENATYTITDSLSDHVNDRSLSPSVFGNYSHNFEYDNSMPIKVFNCFINRGCPNRQSWFYFFIRNNWLDKNYISYWCEDRFGNLNPQDYFDILFESGNQIFQQEHDFAKENLKLPYKNFDINLEQAIIDSQKTLILETYFEDSGFNTFSEKTWRSIQLPRPFLLFSQKNSVKLLRSWGFDVYDDYIDHTYDELENWQNRQQAILKQLNNPIVYTTELLEEFEQRAQHNRNILKSFKQQWPDLFSKFLLQLENL